MSASIREIFEIIWPENLPLVITIIAYPEFLRWFLIKFIPNSLPKKDFSASDINFKSLWLGIKNFVCKIVIF